MQSKLFLLIEKVLRLREFYYVIVGLAVAWSSYITGWITYELTMPLWVHVLLVLFPLLLICLGKGINQRRKRKYKTGDHVRIIADSRHFVAIRYAGVFSEHVICKLLNDIDTLAVHQKYIEPWQELQPIDIMQLLGRTNINRAVPTAIITKL